MNPQLIRIWNYILLLLMKRIEIFVVRDTMNENTYFCFNDTLPHNIHRMGPLINFCKYLIRVLQC